MLRRCRSRQGEGNGREAAEQEQVEPREAVERVTTSSIVWTSERVTLRSADRTASRNAGTRAAGSERVRATTVTYV
jgi:hypothetical protein